MTAGNGTQLDPVLRCEACDCHMPHQPIDEHRFACRKCGTPRWVLADPAELTGYEWPRLVDATSLDDQLAQARDENARLRMLLEGISAVCDLMDRIGSNVVPVETLRTVLASRPV